MRVLLDTNVVSELRRDTGELSVRSAVHAIADDNLFVSVLTIGEITKGINLLDPGRKREALQRWVQGIEKEYVDRILPVDLEVCTIWGEITASARGQGVIIPAVDGLIAATAQRHGLHLMTRNVGDFEATGTMLINPWAS